ncbi:MAG: hypothetical protein J7L14_02010 [Candidatus Diapherotrites archaeon]|nr:hypothetical protein [Candidatus Diapherotrites archaeon]
MSKVSQHSKVIFLIAVLCYLVGLAAGYFLDINLGLEISISGENIIAVVVVAFFISILFFGIGSTAASFIFGYLHSKAIAVQLTNAIYFIPFFISVYSAILLGTSAWNDAAGKENLMPVLKKSIALFLLAIGISIAVMLAEPYLGEISSIIGSIWS